MGEFDCLSDDWVYELIVVVGFNNLFNKPQYASSHPFSVVLSGFSPLLTFCFVDLDAVDYPLRTSEINK